MSDSVKWIEHNNKRILFINLEDLDEEVCVKALDEFIKELSNHADGKMRSLINMPNLTSSLKINEKGKKIIKISKEKNLNSISAIVGMKSWQKSMANLIKGERKVEFFDTIEIAKDWLADQ